MWEAMVQEVSICAEGRENQVETGCIELLLRTIVDFS